MHLKQSYTVINVLHQLLKYYTVTRVGESQKELLKLESVRDKIYHRVHGANRFRLNRLIAKRLCCSSATRVLPINGSDLQLICLFSYLKDVLWTFCNFLYIHTLFTGSHNDT